MQGREFGNSWVGRGDRTRTPGSAAAPHGSLCPSHFGHVLTLRETPAPPAHAHISPTSPFLLLCSPRGCHGDREGGNVGKTPLTGNPPPPPSRGAPLWFKPVSPDRVGVVAVEDSPSPQGLAATGACAREMHPPPRTGKAQVRNKLLCARAARNSPLSPPPGAGDFFSLS